LYLCHLQTAKWMLKDMPLGFQAMLRGAADPHSVTQHGVYRRGLPGEPLQPWGRGRVTFVGDAAVPIRPATGAGSWCTWARESRYKTL
jgi:2-polyprenyl-6-methoxyphenol hydroxylase-like FAD-dependent oxidoreductase